jgi:ATP synthase protein I
MVIWKSWIQYWRIFNKNPCFSHCTARQKSLYSAEFSGTEERCDFVSKLTIKKEAYHIIYWQLILTVGLALVLFLLQGRQSGLSALLGGLAYWLPTLLFVWCIFTRAAVRAAKQFLTLFIAGEGVKLLLSAGLFVLVVTYLPVNAVSVLLGFIGAVVAFWMASMVLLTRHEGVRQ